MVWYTVTCLILAVSVRAFLPLKLCRSIFADIGQDSVVRKPFAKRRQINSLWIEVLAGCYWVEMLSQSHKVLRYLNNIFSTSAKNVFNFFISNFILFLYFKFQKAMCYVSLEFSALRLRQGSTLVAHKGAIFFLLKDAG